MIAFGRQVCGDLDAGAAHEWLVTDGLGGYAMGTVAGLRTRRYHGLLIVAAPGASARRLGLAALDPLVRIGERVVGLATDEWAGGAVDPAGHVHLGASASTAVCRAGAGTSATWCSSARSRWRTGAPPLGCCSAYCTARAR